MLNNLPSDIVIAILVMSQTSLVCAEARGAFWLEVARQLRNRTNAAAVSREYKAFDDSLQ